MISLKFLLDLCHYRGSKPCKW